MAEAAEPNGSNEDANPSVSNEPSTSASSWWGNWLQAAKDMSVEVLDTVRKDVNDLAQSAKVKSAEAYDYVKRDLEELSATVQEEVSSTATALKQKLKIEESGGTAATMKKSLTSFLNQVSDAFYIPPEDDDEPIFLDRLQAQIWTMGLDPATFLVDPEGQEFEAWQESLNLESQQDEISTLLANNEKLRKNLEALVPSQVSELAFWARYLFRIHVLREEEAKRQIIRQEAQARAQSEGRVQGDLNWDEDETLSPNEIPEDVASQLLADYEKECEGRGQKRGSLHCKEKDDMVVVSRAGESGRTSPGKDSSNEEEWEKEFSNVPSSASSPTSPSKQ